MPRTVRELFAEAPPLSDRSGVVAWALEFRGRDSVEVRRQAEDQAIARLNDRAGSMDREQAAELGAWFNTDSRNGEIRHDRFAPAFHGATWATVTEDLDRFNDVVRRLWRGTEEEALSLLDDIFVDGSVMPGAGRSLPSMLLYLRDRKRFAVCLTATARGLAALTGGPVLRRSGGRATYLEFCAKARALADEFDLVPQDVDAVLAIAGRLARESGRIGAGSGLLALPPDAFAFLADLSDHNAVSWMQANSPRYKASLATPFRRLLEQVADQYLVDLDPELDTTVKTGRVLASIKKRFSDEEGDYHAYLWGAYCRHRKQEDVQLYVVIDSRELRFGLNFGNAATDQVARIRAAGERNAAEIWQQLEPYTGELTFALDSDRREHAVTVTNPAEVREWLQGPRPAVWRRVAADEPLATSPEIVDTVGRLLVALHPIAVLGWEDSSAFASQDDTEIDTALGSVADEYTLIDLARDTYQPIEDLEEWVAMLTGSKRQAILYGPPGTGKTFIAKAIARHLAGTTGETQLVQFHPSFSYEDFLEGLRPADDVSHLRYEVRPGIFYKFCELARPRPDATFVFIIDEINRADLGSVLGELLVLLEYRGERLQLPYSQRHFSIPRNVVLLATMNTADRSLALVDFALRRRFHTIELPPSREVLQQYVSNNGVADDPELVMTMFTLIQGAVRNPSVAPGHSYFMTGDLSPDGLRRIWRYEIRPYLAEYWFEHTTHLDELENRILQLLGESA